jgi:hypothetical protein
MEANRAFTVDIPVAQTLARPFHVSDALPLNRSEENVCERLHKIAGICATSQREFSSFKKNIN